MKLHATITSERGKPVTKSANSVIEIIVNDKNRYNIFNLNISTNKDGTEHLLTVINYSTGETTQIKV